MAINPTPEVSGPPEFVPGPPKKMGFSRLVQKVSNSLGLSSQSPIWEIKRTDLSKAEEPQTSFIRTILVKLQRKKTPLQSLSQSKNILLNPEGVLRMQEALKKHGINITFPKIEKQTDLKAFIERLADSIEDKYVDKDILKGRDDDLIQASYFVLSALQHKERKCSIDEACLTASRKIQDFKRGNHSKLDKIFLVLSSGTGLGLGFVAGACIGGGLIMALTPAAPMGVLMVVGGIIWGVAGGWMGSVGAFRGAESLVCKRISQQTEKILPITVKKTDMVAKRKSIGDELAHEIEKNFYESWRKEPDLILRKKPWFSVEEVVNTVGSEVVDRVYSKYSAYFSESELESMAMDVARKIGKEIKLLSKTDQYKAFIWHDRPPFYPNYLSPSCCHSIKAYESEEKRLLEKLSTLRKINITDTELLTEIEGKLNFIKLLKAVQYLIEFNDQSEKSVKNFLETTTGLSMDELKKLREELISLMKIVRREYTRDTYHKWADGLINLFDKSPLVEKIRKIKESNKPWSNLEATWFMYTKHE